MQTQIDIAQLNQIIGRIMPGGRILRAWPLEGGISAQMTAVEIEIPGGRAKNYILRQVSPDSYKINPDSLKNEYQLLKQLQFSGLKTQKPILFEDSCKLLPTPFMVLEFVVGEVDFKPTNLSWYLDEMARELVKIHSLDLMKVEAGYLPALGMRTEIERRSEPQEISALLQEARIRTALSTAAAPADRNKHVLIHGDYWPGNLLWRDGNLAAVIDWEDALIGNPLWDLAITRLDLCCIFGMPAMEEFTENYKRQMNIDFREQWSWDLTAALRFIRMTGSELVSWAEFYKPYGRSDINEQALIERYSLFIDQALEAQRII